MSRQAAVEAYRDSLFSAAVLKFNQRTGSKSFPIVGGLMSSLGLIGNAIARPFKVGAALVFGSGGNERAFPAMPEVPASFKGTDLGKAFEDSWKLQQDMTKAKVQGFADLMKLNVSGWWQESSIAAHAGAKDSAVLFPEDQIRSQGAAVSSGAIGAFTEAMISNRSNRGGSGWSK